MSRPSRWSCPATPTSTPARSVTSTRRSTPLPAGLQDGSELPEPIFTPTTKAPLGEHDQPMTFEQVQAEVGADLAERVRELTTEILRRGNAVAAERGILLADTKVEFGLDHAA